MNNDVRAILFSSDNKIDVTLFTDYKEYNAGTGYIAAENKEKGLCYICRILDILEISDYTEKSQRLVINTVNGIKELTVIVVSTKYYSISDAENKLTELLNVERNG